MNDFVRLVAFLMSLGLAVLFFGVALSSISKIVDGYGMSLWLDVLFSLFFGIMFGKTAIGIFTSDFD